jgi:hypothetical protein
MAQHPPSGDKILVKLMKCVFTLILLAFAISACRLAGSPNKPAAPPDKKTKTTSPPAAAAKTTHKPAASPASSHNAASHTSSARVAKTRTGSTANVKYVRARRGKGGRLVSRAAPAPSYQSHPDPERYQQIQQALADKGYFKGEVNGQWGNDSVDALKRFQADQKLDDDGHLNALTLTGLGLGPKHDGDIGTSGAPAPNPPNSSVPKATSMTPTAPATTPTATAGPPPPDLSVRR